MEVNFTINNEAGKRVNWIKVGGMPLDLEKTYSFVACEREGDPDTTICRVEGVSEPKRLGFTLHSVIEEYLKIQNRPYNTLTISDNLKTKIGLSKDGV